MNRSHLKAWVLTGSILSGLLFAQSSATQVIPDATLPAGERSQVTGNPNVQIDGGARRGGNLFHSFSQFSIPTGGSAYFNNAADVRNIFSRVTGGSISNIDGVIRANGTANLFLLNPNGILFSPNASLNIGGSFVATTANAIGFPNGEVFSSDATQPLPSQLLTVNPNVFFFNQLTPKPIVNRSTVNGTGLQVPFRQNLLLIGGAVQLEEGKLISPGSYVELAGIDEIGTAALSTASEDWQLTIPDGVTRANVSLGNESDINVKGVGGSIRMLAQNIDISDSQLRIEIPSDSRVPTTQTGDLELNATGSITISNSLLANSLFGEGTIGNINLTAGNTISLDNSYVYDTLEDTGIGKIGNINLTTGSLSLTAASQLILFTVGSGNTGDLNINTRNTVALDKRSAIYSDAIENYASNGGIINITTRSLFITDNSLLNLTTGGQEDAGSININAHDSVSLVDSWLSSNVSYYGNAGSINVNAHNTISLYQSEISTSGGIVERISNSGSINVTAGSLSLLAGSEFHSDTFGQGNAGSVNINVRDRVSLSGVSPDTMSYGYGPSSISTRVLPGAVGQGGDVTIRTGVLSLTNGGAVDTSVLSVTYGADNIFVQGQGNAGRVTIQARDIQISGAAPSAINVFGEVVDLPSGITTSTGLRSTGNGGDVSITTGLLSVSDQGRISTNTQAQGKAGNIQIQASDTVSFDGGKATSILDSGGAGRGGDIDINARSLSVLNNAQLSAFTAGEGNAGNITVSADTVGVSSGGQLLTTTSSKGRAGDITVNTPDLQLSGATSGLFAGTNSIGNAGNLTVQPRGEGQSVRVNLQDGAQISASTSSSGRGGELTIAAPESITLTGNGSIIAAGTAGSGDGGNLNLQTGTLNIQNQAKVTVSSSGIGSAGNLFVDADRIFLNNQGSIRADTSGGGGNINLRSPLILLRNGSNITTNATGANIPGGNIGIDTRFLVAVPNEDSNISANSEDFRGGNVRINAFSIFGIQPSLVSTPLSDITATGATSALSGTTNVSTAGIDPTSGLVALPTDFVDPSGLIAQGCPANQGNSFVISGRGGLPPTPEQQLDDDANWQDRRRLVANQQLDGGGEGDTETASILNSQLSIPNSPPLPHTPIIEATGWLITPAGEISLVASTPYPTMQNRLKWSIVCSRGESSK